MPPLSTTMARMAEDEISAQIRAVALEHLGGNATFADDDLTRISAKLTLLTRLVENLEWSGSTGSAGVSMGGPPMSYHPSCPQCGGLDPSDEGAHSNFVDEAFGHRSGCVIAEALGRSTVIREGESGSLAL